MKCPNCQNDNADTSKFCVFCGTELKKNISNNYTDKKQKKDNDPVICLILGIISFFTSAFFLGIPVAIGSLVLGIPSIRRNHPKKGLAVVGITLSILGLVFTGIIYFYVYSEVKAGTEAYNRINEYIEAENYDEAIKEINKSHFSSEEKNNLLYDVSIKKEDYDSAAGYALNSIDTDKESELCNIKESDYQRITDIYDKLSQSKKDEFDAFLKKIEDAKVAEQARIEASIAASIEAEEKKAEEAAKAAQKEAEEKAKAEEKAAKEKATADKKAAEEKAAADKKAAEEKAAAETEMQQTDAAHIDEESESLENDYPESNNTSSAGIYEINTFPFYYNKEAKKVLDIYNEAMANKDNWHYVDEEESVFVSPNTFKETLRETEYQYYGKIKNGNPDGIGVLFEHTYEFDDYPKYIGNFSNGTFSGYGIQIYLSNDGMVLPTLQYEGYYKKGEYNGEGVEYEVYYGTPFSIDLTGEAKDIFYNSNDNENWITGCFVEFKGNYKNGELSGKGTKYFEDGQVWYDGEWKKGKFHGKGTLYDEEGHLVYKGDFKDGDYSGNGTLYNEDGSVRYKGKFEYGDIK